jgi:hypothetical protein
VLLARADLLRELLLRLDMTCPLVPPVVALDELGPV